MNVSSQLVDLKQTMSALTDKLFKECEVRKSSLPDASRDTSFDEYMKTCINHHVSCALGVCPNGYAHATDCGYIIDSYIAVHRFKRRQKYDSETWLPGVDQIALYIIYNDANKFIHKLGIHQFKENKYRIIQGMRARYDAYTTLTHNPSHNYSKMTSKEYSTFFKHQKRYGLPYNLDGYSTKEQVKEFCIDMQKCKHNESNPDLVFGGNTPGRVTTFMYTSKTEEEKSK